MHSSQKSYLQTIVDTKTPNKINQNPKNHHTSNLNKIIERVKVPKSNLENELRNKRLESFGFGETERSWRERERSWRNRTAGLVNERLGFKVQKI